MATHPLPDGGSPPISSSVSYDFQTAFVGAPNDYSTVLNQQMALQVPLGSQLNLLTAQNIGNKYVNSARLSDEILKPEALNLKGYNTLQGNPAGTNGYFTFGGAYRGNF
jgi:hypothetical protein